MSCVPRKCFAIAAAAALVFLTSCGGEAGRADENGSPAADNPPAFSEIENDMWGSMSQAGSTTVQLDMSVFSMGDPIQATRLIEVYGQSDAPFENSGMLDGSASFLHHNGHELARVFPHDVIYLTGGAVLSIVDVESFEELERSSVPSDLLEVWVDFSDEAKDRFTDGAYDVGEDFYDMHRSWYRPAEQVSSGLAHHRISDQGTVEMRNDVEVWVYSAEDTIEELVIEGSLETPRMLSRTYEYGEVHFTDWGEVEAPERPDEDEVLSLEEFEEQVLAAVSE